jgi:hypothetical protein
MGNEMTGQNAKTEKKTRRDKKRGSKGRNHMKFVNTSVTNGLAAAALVVLCSAQVSLAGYTSVLSNNVGQVSATLGYSTPGYTNKAITAYPVTNPSAGVTTAGTWTVRTNQPSGVSTVCTSTVQVLNIFGYKAVAKSYVTSGVTADPSPELGDRLLQDGFVLIPNPCGSDYVIASGDETINGQRYLVVLGNATGGTAAWFRGYFFDGTPIDRDDIIQHGVKLYDVVITGPFDFGDINSTDRCNALKIPINYTGPKLYLVSDGGSVSTTDLQINCPSSPTNIPCGSSVTYPSLTTSGGCGAASITYNPPVSALAPGTNNVTATATDAAGNVATCQFQAVRPFLTLGSSGFASPISGIGGSCTNPVAKVKGGGSGGSVQIKFSTYLCNTLYNPTTPPTVTITKLDTNCQPSVVEISGQQLSLTSNTWHWQWNTLQTDIGYFKISVNLGDGNPNPNYAIVQLY